MDSLLNYRLKRLQRGVFAKLALLSSRFHPLLQPSVPLVKMEYRGATQSKNLIIFLPGIDDVAEDFERRGFIDDMRRHGIGADAIAVDAHYGYYASRAIHTRITDDIIASAYETGYERIWLAGVSLGGFGAASYAARHTSHIAGLLLLAPYLGGRELVGEIACAGGIRQWEPGVVREGDYQRALWTSFKQGFASNQAELPIYLGYGKRDMFEQANTLVADVLPPQQVFAIPGGHDWRTWKQLWQMFLENWKTTLR
jgi:pimeloyl-ACP methyl ester carboxylesterase